MTKVVLYSFHIPFLLFLVIVGGSGYFIAKSDSPVAQMVRDKVSNSGITQKLREENEIKTQVEKNVGVVTDKKLIISEEQLNLLAQSKVEGQGMDGSLTVKSITIDLQEDMAIVSATLSDGVHVLVDLVVSKDGKSVAVSDTKVEGGGMFSGFKADVLSVALNTTIDRFVDGHREEFDRIEIEDGSVVVYLN